MHQIYKKMKTKLLLLTLSLIFLNTAKSDAQISARWYSYGDYLYNETATDNVDLYLWNDTTGVFGYSGTPSSYSGNNFTSVGMSFAPVLSAWNNVPLYGSTIKVGPSDIYTIDSVRIYGSYNRNNAKPLVKDTLRLGFVYGNGTATTNVQDYILVGPSLLPEYGYDTVSYIEMAHDSLNNIAGKFTGVVTSPYVQSIILTTADTASAFERAYALSTPFTVPAGNFAAMSLTFKSGDASFTPFDTVSYASGDYKYGVFATLIVYAGTAGSPVFAPYAPVDSNVGYFKEEGAADAGYGGLYAPTWAWVTAVGASYLQYPVIDFHINCPTCDLSDTITGTTHVCAGASSPLAHSLTGGSWSSSSTSVASVSGTGSVTGVASGVVTITYTLSGHHAYTSFTVNPSPLTITGTTHVCTGSSTTLVDGSTGGTWSSGSTGVAGVDLLTGSVSGLAPGSTVITYTLGTGCTTTTIVTVNPSPLAISGVIEVCAAHTTTLADGTTGGTWTSASTATATVGAGTGIVTGLIAGTDNITYTIGTGCFSSTMVTVQTTPVAGTVTGASTVCPGLTVSLSDGIAGGAWSSGATGTASVNSSGIVTGVAAGSVTISYSVTNSCGTANSPYIITVEPAPNAGTVTAPADSVCEGSTIALADSVTTGTWSSTNTLAATVDATGLVTGIAAGADNIIYTATNSCGTVNASLTITVLSTIECSELSVGSFSGLASADLKIFPNPNHGTFAVNLLSNSNEQVNIVITNIIGEKVQEITTATNKLTGIILNEPQGMYILRAITSTGQYVAKLMIE